MKIKFFLFFLITALFTACSSTTQTIPLNEKCYEKPEMGKCRAYYPKYYFEEEDKTCKKFIWGGCGGNIPFNTLKECKSLCER